MAYAHAEHIANGLTLDFTVQGANTGADNFLGYNSSGEVTSFTGIPASRVSGGGNITEATSSVLLITGGTAAALGAVTIQVKVASSVESGYLSQADWTTFNNKMGNTLGNGFIYVGNVSNVPVGVAMTGDIGIDNTGLTAIGANKIVNAQINSNAAIAQSKMAALTASLVMATNGSGFATTVAGFTTTIAGYLTTLTSNAQNQINGKLSVTLTSPTNGQIISYNGSAWVNSNSTGITAGGTTHQIFRKIDNTNFNTEWHTLVAADITDVTSSAAELNKLTGVTTTAAQFNFLNTATSDIQVQLTNSLSKFLTQNYLFVGNVSGVAAPFATGPDTYLLTSVGGVPTWTPPTSGGTVTSVGVSGGTTGLTTSGTPVTTSGTITLAGTLIAVNGGTGFASYTVGDILYANTTTTLAKLAAGTITYVLTSNGAGVAPTWQAAAAGSGTVTSFSAGTLSPLFTTSVATATTTPALTFALVNQNKNLVYSGPASGSAAAPTFRALVLADIPFGTANQILGTNNAGTAIEHKTVSNGLISASGTFKLGGVITGDTIISDPTQTHTFTIGDSDGLGSDPLAVININANQLSLSGGASASISIDNAKTSMNGPTFFQYNNLKIYNPSTNFEYTLVGSAIAANRNITLPLLAGNDVMVTADFIQTLTNKSFGTGTKIVLGSDATGDLHYTGGSGLLTRLAAGAVNYVLTSGGAGVAPSWVATTGSPMSSILSATGTNSIDNANFKQTWNWNALTLIGLSLESTSTAAASNGQILLNLSLSGANGTATQTTRSLFASNTHTGAGTNIAGWFTASGGSNNYAIIAAVGLVGLGITTPTAYLHLKAGTATADTAPIKIEAGVLLSSPENGAIETDSSHLYYTIGGTRYQLDQQSITSASLSSLTAATGTNTIDNLGFTQAWNWSTLTSNGLQIASASTALTNGSYLFSAVLNGANASSNILSVAGYFLNQNTGTGSTNVAGWFSAVSGTNNYGIIVANGYVGIGTTTPTAPLHVTQAAQSSGSNKLTIFTGAAHTNQTAGASPTDIDFALNRTVQVATGAASFFNAIVMRAPTYSFVGTSTITDAATLYIAGSPAAGTNATINSSWDLLTTGNVNIGGKLLIGVNFSGSPLSTLEVQGSFGPNLTSVSTDTTLSVTHYTVKVDASGANRTITLPTAAGCTRRVYVIKKSDSTANTVTIDGNGSETIDGALTKVINTQYAGYVIQSDGTGWNVIATF